MDVAGAAIATVGAQFVSVICSMFVLQKQSLPVSFTRKQCRIYGGELKKILNVGIPIALQEAAKLDGANDFTIWLKVILPLCTPTIATVALFLAVGQWNSFMDTYLYARELPTLQYVLYQIMEQATIQIDPHQTSQLTNAVSPMSVRMAITIVATVPILVVYPFLQKYFVGGMTLGAVKD